MLPLLIIQLSKFIGRHVYCVTCNIASYFAKQKIWHILGFKKQNKQTNKKNPIADKPTKKAPCNWKRDGACVYIYIYLCFSSIIFKVTAMMKNSLTRYLKLQSFFRLDRFPSSSNWSASLHLTWHYLLFTTYLIFFTNFCSASPADQKNKWIRKPRWVTLPAGTFWHAIILKVKLAAKINSLTISHGEKAPM